MAVSEFSSSVELGTKPTITGRTITPDLEMGSLYPPGGSHEPYVMNKAWHVPTTQWVRWLTVEPDNSGFEYPGPGTFGECTDFKLEVVTYQPVE